MDRLQAMKTFVTVVESGGFTAAARKLDVSLSVVSRVVTELEAHLGVRLLTRTTRLVRPTDTGAAYFEDCRRILAEIDDAELATTGAHMAPRGPPEIAAFEGAERLWRVIPDRVVWREAALPLRWHPQAPQDVNPPRPAWPSGQAAAAR